MRSVKHLVVFFYPPSLLLTHNCFNGSVSNLNVSRTFWALKWFVLSQTCLQKVFLQFWFSDIVTIFRSRWDSRKSQFFLLRKWCDRTWILTHLILPWTWHLEFNSYQAALISHFRSWYQSLDLPKVKCGQINENGLVSCHHSNQIFANSYLWYQMVQQLAMSE